MIVGFAALIITTAGAAAGTLSFAAKALIVAVDIADLGLAIAPAVIDILESKRLEPLDRVETFSEIMKITDRGRPDIELVVVIVLTFVMAGLSRISKFEGYWNNKSVTPGRFVFRLIS